MSSTGPLRMSRGLSPASSFMDLTPRQRDVALLLIQGKSNKEISEAIGCSQKTVDTHRACAIIRLGLRNNVELTLYAVRAGLVPGLGVVERRDR